MRRRARGQTPGNPYRGLFTLVKGCDGITPAGLLHSALLEALGNPEGAVGLALDALSAAVLRCPPDVATACAARALLAVLP